MRCLGTAQGLGTGRGRGRGHQRASWGVGQAVQVSPDPPAAEPEKRGQRCLTVSTPFDSPTSS